MQYILLSYLIINLIALCLMGVDKRKAKKQKYRIKESLLLSVGFFGCIGFVSGMLWFHHKVSKPKFWVVAPIYIWIHAILVSVFIYFNH